MFIFIFNDKPAGSTECCSSQKEINPYPADMDFAEHINIEAASKNEVKQIFKSLIQKTVDLTSNNDNLEFTELKLGIYPIDAPLSLRGQDIKWTTEEVKSGIKTTSVPNSKETYSISFENAFDNAKMIKMDWLTFLSIWLLTEPRILKAKEF